MTKDNHIIRHSDQSSLAHFSESIPEISKTLKHAHKFTFHGDYDKLRKIIDKNGFTIIEIIMVIAIGGLILIMSFAAINTSQRSKRDAQRKTDLATINREIASAVNENFGILPTDLSGITLPTAPNSGTYTRPPGGVGTSCSDANQVYYERINDRAYKIKICLEAGEYSESH